MTAAVLRGANLFGGVGYAFGAVVGAVLERVVRGSHNLTNMGATTNRDASLLFDDVPLAEYFGKLFEHDWRISL
jgi:hypothetical protein